MKRQIFNDGHFSKAIQGTVALGFFCFVASQIMLQFGGGEREETLDLRDNVPEEMRVNPCLVFEEGYPPFVSSAGALMPEKFVFSVGLFAGGLMMILIELVLCIIIILLSILLVMAVRQIPVQYARRSPSGTNEKNVFGSRQYIPLKLNASGVMPIIFAQALMFAPAYLGGAFGDSAAGQWLQTNFSDIFGLWYNILFLSLIHI